MAAPFNTLNHAQALQKAGIPTEQAEALTNALVNALQEAELATKNDLNTLRAETKQEISSLRTEMKQEISSLHAEMKEGDQQLKSTQMVHSWMLGFLVTATLALLGGVGSLVLKGFSA
jgi:type VI protein secretion system component VasF